MRLQKMSEEYYTSLSRVLHIIQTHPESVVDDTALDRLLLSLETIAKENNTRLVDILVRFYDIEDSWKEPHPITACFGLRLAGISGSYLCEDEQITTTLQHIIKKLAHHCVAYEPGVRHGLYTCLKCLASNNKWIVFLEEFMEICRKDLTSSFLYVRKICWEFLASFLHSSLFQNIDVYSTATLISMLQHSKNILFLRSLCNCAIVLVELNVRVSVRFLNMSNFLETVIKTAESCTHDGALESLVDDIVSLFESLRSKLGVLPWSELFPLSSTSESLQKFLKEFIEFVRQNKSMRCILPRLCISVLEDPSVCKELDSESLSGCDWNRFLFHRMFDDIDEKGQQATMTTERNSLLLGTREWKKVMSSTLNVMTKLNKNHYFHESTIDILKRWFSYALDVLEVSLNQVNGKELNERMVSIINDKKITRLCFAYIKNVSYKDLQEDSKMKYVNTLWNVLNTSSDSAQIMCHGLDLLSVFIIKNDLKDLFTSELHTMRNLDTVLNMRMCDVTWEVRESLMTSLISMVTACKEGSTSCEEFLGAQTFWCSFLQALDDEESFVRSKAVSLLKVIALTPSVAVVFYGSKPLSEIWDMIEKIFICFERQDDMFTRRSILELIGAWIENDVIIPYNDNSENRTLKRQIELSRLNVILENAVGDFDWEIRLRCCTVIVTVVKSMRRSVNCRDGYLKFVCNVFANTVAKLICDCEYKVKVEVLCCLEELGLSFGEKDEGIQKKFDTSLNDGRARSSSSSSSVDASVVRTNEDTTGLKKIKNKPNVTTDSLDNSNEGNQLSQTYEENTLNTFEQLELFVANLHEINMEKQLSHFLGTVDFDEIRQNMKEMDDTVRNDPCSFLNDIIASAKGSEGNLLDCY